MGDVVRTLNLTRRYGRRVAVDCVTLGVPEGLLFGFLGPNGSGKTTTIRVLLGFLKASAGQATVFGLDAWRESRRIKAEVGYLPGDLRLYPFLTGRETLRMVSRLRGRDLMSAGGELAASFDLDLERRVETMSRGTRQKLGLILALCVAPRLLVLDEPTNGLDPIMQERLYVHLRRLAAAGHTVFFSSHTLSEVERLCDRVAILREGRLVADESLETLRARAERSVVIRWPAGAASDGLVAPSGLQLSSREPLEWRGSVVGAAGELIRWCADHRVEDVSISPPNLSTVFQRFYDQGG